MQLVCRPLKGQEREHSGGLSSESQWRRRRDAVPHHHCRSCRRHRHVPDLPSPDFSPLPAAALIPSAFCERLYHRFRRRHHPRHSSGSAAFYWLSHPQWIWMTLGLTILAPSSFAACSAFGSGAHSPLGRCRRARLLAVGSCATSDRLGNPLIVSVLIGVVTGVFGGMLRDVFCAKLPLCSPMKSLTLPSPLRAAGIPRAGARRTRAGRHRALGLLRPSS